MPKLEDAPLFSLITAGLMSLIMSAVLSVADVGAAQSLLLRWAATFSLAFPVAFIAMRLVQPIARRLAQILYRRWR